jgi:hypothetical protein
MFEEWLLFAAPGLAVFMFPGRPLFAAPGLPEFVVPGRLVVPAVLPPEVVLGRPFAVEPECAVSPVLE